jgi:hypothetical protein
MATHGANSWHTWPKNKKKNFDLVFVFFFFERSRTPRRHAKPWRLMALTLGTLGQKNKKKEFRFGFCFFFF